MEKIKDLIMWLQGLPLFGKVISVIILALVSILIVFSASSCGTTRAVAHTSDKGVTTITITTNNPISTQVDPNVDFNLSKDAIR